MNTREQRRLALSVVQVKYPLVRIQIAVLCCQPRVPYARCHEQRMRLAQGGLPRGLEGRQLGAQAEQDIDSILQNLQERCHRTLSDCRITTASFVCSESSSNMAEADRQ
jgi:hypothetical protein